MLDLLPGLLVLLTLVLGVLLHVAVLADALGILGLVRAAGSTFLSAKFEVAISAHSFGIVLRVEMFALCDSILLADHRFFSLGSPGAAPCSLLSNQFLIEIHRFNGMFKVLGT